MNTKKKYSNSSLTKPVYPGDGRDVAPPRVRSSGRGCDAPATDEGRARRLQIPGKENIVQRVLQGIVTVISPWNFPLNLSMRAVAPAIAAGNAGVLKPATNTPIVGGLLLARPFEEAGLPDGVLNVVTGRGSDIGDRVASHPESDVVAFTGSTEVGRRVASAAGENLAVAAMELGGNNAHIVTADADIDAAIDAGVFRSFVHQGQVCISINRHLVHEEYVAKLTERAEGLPVGSAHDQVAVGPIIDLDGVNDSLVVAPTVLSDAVNGRAAACNEHFGPIAPVVPFSSVDEAVELANATGYGLSGSVHADDVGGANASSSASRTA